MNKANLNKIFLSINKIKQSKSEKRLMLTLERAGFSFSSATENKLSVLPSSSTNLLTADMDSLDSEIENSICSIHFIEKNNLKPLDEISMTELHFNKARLKIEKDENYKAFIWMPGKFDDSDADKNQLDFINKMQHHLSNNMILSRVPAAIQFVEDVRLIMEQQTKKIFDTIPTDVFLIVSQLDENEALRIELMLKGVLKTVKLVIVQNADINYEEYAAQQMNVSSLTVIYYKNASDWALPFIQQIWKKVGGANAKSPIIFIRDPASINSKIFIAKKVTCLSIQSELIPLEIKMQFDSLNDKVI